MRSEGRKICPVYVCMCSEYRKGRRGVEESRNTARRRSAYAGKVPSASPGLAPKSRPRFPLSHNTSSFLGYDTHAEVIPMPLYLLWNTLVLHISIFRCTRPNDPNQIRGDILPAVESATELLRARKWQPSPHDLGQKLGGLTAKTEGL